MQKVFLFLDRMAVQYIAVPDARLTQRGAREMRLVTTTLPGVHQVWTGEHWRLYAVDDSLPVVAGAQLDAYRADRITFTVRGRGDVRVRIRWLRELVLRGPAGTCLRSDAGGAAVVLRDAAPGTYAITSGLLAGSRTC